MLTDVVDSTALNSALGDSAMRRLWDTHDRLARGLIRRCGGREIGRSDGFLIVFDRADEAVAFSVAYHQALDGFEPPLRARVGIHIGELTLRENAVEDVAAGATRFDIDGIALPVAARISAIAQGRQTLVSAALAGCLSSGSHEPRSHGMWQFKGLDEPIEVLEIGDEHASWLPPEDGDKGVRVVDIEGDWFPAREIPHSIPLDRDPFVGRQAELRHIAGLFAADVRLVSVVGIGGVGKTRLARHVVRRWLGQFPGGAWFCDLADARDASGIYSAVSLGLDTAFGRADPASRLASAIAGRRRCVILLDNCEQVLEPLLGPLQTWLDSAPHATFLVTSRERLGIVGEHVCAVDALAPAAATELFTIRGQAVVPALNLEPADVTTIGELVDLLDRLPLAIELAAGRLAVMSPATMLRRLNERFHLLAANCGTRPKRQQTLRAALDWSWDLLGLAEKGVLAQASVFAGGFDLQAGEAILVTAGRHGAGTVLDALQSLVDKSLVRFERDRFMLLVSVREYAAEMLRDLVTTLPDSGLDAVEVRHGVYYSARMHGPAADFENVLAACRRAIARRDHGRVAQACAAAWRWLETRGPLRVALELFDGALAIDGIEAAARIPIGCLRGRALLLAGDRERARAVLMQALDDSRAAGMNDEVLRALSSLGELNVTEGRLDEAQWQLDEAVRIADELAVPSARCGALNGQGVYYNRLGRFKEARERFLQVLELARAAGELRWQGAALANLGSAEANLGNRADAKRYYDAAIVVVQELGDRLWEGNLLCNLGLFNLEDGDQDAARDQLQRSLTLAREGGVSFLESVVLCNLGLLAEAGSDDAAAERSYRDALAVAARRGDTRAQGQVQGYLGLVVVRRGNMAEGRALLDGSVRLLRQVRDRSSLAIALCRHAQACVWAGECDGARSALEEAAALAAEIGVAEKSELATALDAARHAIKAGSS